MQHTGLTKISTKILEIQSAKGFKEIWEDIFLSLIMKESSGNWHFAIYHFVDSNLGIVLFFEIEVAEE